jgi:hypothetical protein
MSENAVYLQPQPEPVAHYLRLGAFHRQVEKLLAAGRLPVERVVVEASAFTHQKDVVRQLVDAGRELMLDTNVAELVDPAARVADTAAKLALADAATTEMLQRTNDRLARLGPVLRDLHATMGDRPHAHAPARRGNRAAGAHAARR